jgi:hypothetical protein
VNSKSIDRSKNMFALGLTFWIYDRPLAATLDWVSRQFKAKPEVIEANHRALHAGYHFGETTEAFQVRYHVAPASLPAGTYRKITGNEAVIGRWDADNGVFPDVDLDVHDGEAKVSRRHARIKFVDGKYLIEDLGSTNGTYVNRGRRLLPGNAQALVDGDEVIVGKTFMRFHIIG